MMNSAIQVSMHSLFAKLVESGAADVRWDDPAWDRHLGRLARDEARDEWWKSLRAPSEGLPDRSDSHHMSREEQACQSEFRVLCEEMISEATTRIRMGRRQRLTLDCWRCGEAFTWHAGYLELVWAPAFGYCCRPCASGSPQLLENARVLADAYGRRFRLYRGQRRAGRPTMP